jgi:GxxExxY protein
MSLFLDRVHKSADIKVAENEMPIECDVKVGEIGQEGFHAVDYEVMRHSYDIHNSLGRFFDEKIYQEELAQRCRASGLEAHREVLVRVSHRDFTKHYYLDLLVQRGAIYELKTTGRLTKAHQAQLINYLLLMGLGHGKLVSYRPSSVESRFVSTKLRRKDRKSFRLLDDAWNGSDEKSCMLRDCLNALLADWGAFLDSNLYREALVHFLNGPGHEGHSVDIESDGRIIGMQKMHLLDDETAWHLTSVPQHLGSQEQHIQRLLHHTHLKRLQWVNISQRTITLTTLTN